MTFVFDIDGTLSTITDRSPFDYQKAGQDVPIDAMVKVCNGLRMYAEVIFVTGRPESCREVTLKWLKKHVHYNIRTPDLFMRPNWLPNGKADYRPSPVVKEEIINNQLKDVEITAWFDDDLRVIEMLKKRGILIYSTNQEQV